MPSPFPEGPEGVSFMMFFAALAAAYDPANKARVAGLLDLFAEVRRTVDGERQLPDGPHH